MIYNDMKGMAEIACKNPTKFIEMTKKSEVKDFTKYVGFNLAAEQDIMLKSCRRILNTEDWNPLTYALLIHE